MIGIITKVFTIKNGFLYMWNITRKTSLYSLQTINIEGIRFPHTNNDHQEGSLQRSPERSPDQSRPSSPTPSSQLEEINRQESIEGARDNIRSINNNNFDPDTNTASTFPFGVSVDTVGDRRHANDELRARLESIQYRRSQNSIYMEHQVASQGNVGIPTVLPPSGIHYQQPSTTIIDVVEIDGEGGGGQINYPQNIGVDPSQPVGDGLIPLDAHGQPIQEINMAEANFIAEQLVVANNRCCTLVTYITGLVHTVNPEIQSMLVHARDIMQIIFNKWNDRPRMRRIVKITCFGVGLVAVIIYAIRGYRLLSPFAGQVVAGIFEKTVENVIRGPQNSNVPTTTIGQGPIIPHQNPTFGVLYGYLIDNHPILTAIASLSFAASAKVAVKIVRIIIKR